MNSVTPWLKSCLRKELKGHSKEITVAHIFHTQVFAYTKTFKKSMLIDFPEIHISQYALYKYSNLPFTRQRYKSFRSTAQSVFPAECPYLISYIVYLRLILICNARDGCVLSCMARWSVVEWIERPLLMLEVQGSNLGHSISKNTTSYTLEAPRGAGRTPGYLN